MQPVASSLMNTITQKGVMRAKGHDGGTVPLLPLSLMIKVLEKNSKGLEKDNIIQGHSNSGWAGRQSLPHPSPPPLPLPHYLQFPNQTRSNSFSFKQERYCFLQVFIN